MAVRAVWIIQRVLMAVSVVWIIQSRVYIRSRSFPVAAVVCVKFV